MASRPRGVSLVELMIVLAVLGVAAGALARIATRQQQHYRALAARTISLGQLREGSEVLASELAGISAVAGDIYEDEMLDASIGFRSAAGTYLLCAPPRDGTNEIDVVRLGTTAQADQSSDDESTGNAPAAGDSLWLYDAGPDIAAADDGWHGHAIAATVRVLRPCAPASDSGDVTVARLTITPAPSRSLAHHAPVRLFRRARYTLYRSGDAAWYLGFTDCRPLVRNPPCAPLQPVSGPYLPYAAAGASRPSGLTFLYLDRDGRPTDDRFAVAAIELTLRAGSLVGGTESDPTVARRVIALRNTTR